MATRCIYRVKFHGSTTVRRHDSLGVRTSLRRSGACYGFAYKKKFGAILLFIVFLTRCRVSESVATAVRNYVTKQRIHQLHVKAKHQVDTKHTTIVHQLLLLCAVMCLRRLSCCSTCIRAKRRRYRRTTCTLSVYPICLLPLLWLMCYVCCNYTRGTACRVHGLSVEHAGGLYTSVAPTDLDL